MESLQGHLLVASPHLPDPNFFRSVVLMVQHDDQGALGLILNRPTNATVGELWGNLTKESCECPEAVYCGGPVQGPLMSLHSDIAWADNEVLPGLYFASREDYLRKIVQAAVQPFRLFLGYSGWSAGQLENEVEVGGWLTMPATLADIFDAPDDLWRKTVSRIGAEILRPAIKTRHIPQDPSLN